MNEKPKENTRQSATIDKSLHALLKQYSLQTGFKMNHLIDDAVRKYIREFGDGIDD